MPLLSGNTTENFGVTLSGTGTVGWLLSAINNIDPGPQTEGVSNQGVINAAGATIIQSSLAGAHGAASRELQFFSAINLGTSSNVVSLGKIVTPTQGPSGTLTNSFYQFSSPSTLQPGESLIYVKSAGFQVYDSNGLKKDECCAGTGTGIGPGAGAVAAQSYQANGQSIPNSTNKAVVFDTLIFATPASMYGTAAPTRLVAPQAGLYEALASVAFSTASANVPAELWFQVNGVAGKSGDYQQHITAIAGQNTSLLTSFFFNLNAGDYVEAWVWHNNGSALALADGAGPTTFFSLNLVR